MEEQLAMDAGMGWEGGVISRRGLRSLHAKTTSVHRVFVKEIGTANLTWEVLLF